MEKDDLVRRAELAAEKLAKLGNSRNPVALNAGSEPGNQAESVELLLLEAPGAEAEWALASASDPLNISPTTENLNRRLPPLVSELTRQVPAIAQAIARGDMLELIGPAKVLNGLREGSLELIPAKAGGLVGGIRKVGEKKIAHQARFRQSSLASAVGPQLVFSLVTAAVGAAHLAEIHRQIARVNERLDLVLETLQSERHGVLAGAVTTMSEIARQHAATGTFSPAMLQRLLLVDRDVRSVREQLRRLNDGYRARCLANADLSKLEDTFGAARAIILHDARMTVLAEASLMEVDRLMLAYEYEHEPQNARIRTQNESVSAERIKTLGTELEYLGQSASTARLRLGELSCAIHRQIFSAERIRAFRRLLDREQENVLEIENAIRSLGQRSLATEEPRIIRVTPQISEFVIEVEPLQTIQETNLGRGASGHVCSESD